MAFENKGIDFQIDLVKPAYTQPEPEKCFDREQYLEAAHAIGADFTENLCKHIDTGQYGHNQRRRNDFAYMFHKSFSGFLGLFRGETLPYFGEKQVVSKEKTAIDKRTVEVNQMYNCVENGRSFFAPL